MKKFPTLEEIKKTRERLGTLIQETPAHLWTDPRLTEQVGKGTEVFVKLELFQVTGTFKPRGALNVMLNLSPSQLKQGVTAVSAGNHAIATAYAAKALGTSAKVVMPKTANPLRMKLSRDLGAEIELAESPLEAFARVKQIEEEEGRSFIHPFEGPLTLQGTGTAGWEFTRQVPELDARGHVGPDPQVTLVGLGRVRRGAQTGLARYKNLWRGTGRRQCHVSKFSAGTTRDVGPHPNYC